MANENKTAKEYVQKGYLIAHLANCGIRTINYDEWERLCECIHEAKPADVVEVVRCKDCKHKPYRGNDGFVSPEVGKCPCINDDDSFYSWIPEDDWFCADAERSEDGTT